MKERLTFKGEPSTDPTSGAPTDEKLSDGQHKDHWVLSADERAKGFIRPVRTHYKHVGPVGPQHPLRDLDEDEQRMYSERFGYVKFETYPKDMYPQTGRYWTQKQLDSVASGGCGGVTNMSVIIAETYAREPSFYGSTFCSHCRRYLPVGPSGEFVWDDDTRVGT